MSIGVPSQHPLGLRSGNGNCPPHGTVLRGGQRRDQEGGSWAMTP